MPPEPIEPELVDLAPETTAVIRAVVPSSELAAHFDRSFPTLAAVITGQGVAIAGPAFALYHEPPGERVHLEVGFVTDRPVRPEGEVEAGSLPGGKVARLVHRGGYDGLGPSWERLTAWAEVRGRPRQEAFWEVYVTEPSPDGDPAELRTDLYLPVEG